MRGASWRSGLCIASPVAEAAGRSIRRSSRSVALALVLRSYVVEERIEISLDRRAADPRAVEELQDPPGGEEAQVVHVGDRRALLAGELLEAGEPQDGS